MGALCPNLEQSCEDCIADFVFDHPGVEIHEATCHLFCDCPMVASPPDDQLDNTCVGCGEKRDLWAEFWRGFSGRAA